MCCTSTPNREIWCSVTSPESNCPTRSSTFELPIFCKLRAYRNFYALTAYVVTPTTWKGCELSRRCSKGCHLLTLLHRESLEQWLSTLYPRSKPTVCTDSSRLTRELSSPAPPTRSMLLV